MQKIISICDMCMTENRNNDGHTVDLSWLKAGYEVDLCDTHERQLNEQRKEIEDIWLKDARRVTTRPGGPGGHGGWQNQRRKAASGKVVRTPIDGVEGVDWRWSARGQAAGGRRVRIVHSPCDFPGCTKVFDSPQSLSSHQTTLGHRVRVSV